MLDFILILAWTLAIVTCYPYTLRLVMLAISRAKRVISGE